MPAKPSFGVTLAVDLHPVVFLGYILHVLWSVPYQKKAKLGWYQSVFLVI